MNPTLATHLVLTALLAFSGIAAAQQNADGRLPVSSAPRPYLFLIRDPAVHDDLRLDSSRRRAVAALNDELDGPLWSMRNKSPQHIEETRQKTTATAKTRISSILTPDQQRRLEQIELWTLGTNAFMQDDLPQKLGLSDDRLERIRKTITETAEAAAALAEQLQSGRSQQSVDEAAQKLQAAAQKEILATLTRRQRDDWISLLGKRIDVSQLGRVKFKAPPLHGREGWINSSPLDAGQHQGRVVALYFYAFG